MPAAPAAPAYVPAEEDALPTQRTMDTLRRAAVHADPASKSDTGFLAMLSTRAKVAVCAIAAAIVLAIVLICVNTALLNSAEAAVMSRQEQVQVLAQRAEELVYRQLGCGTRYGQGELTAGRD